MSDLVRQLDGWIASWQLGSDLSGVDELHLRNVLRTVRDEIERLEAEREKLLARLEGLEAEVALLRFRHENVGTDRVEELESISRQGRR